MTEATLHAHAPVEESASPYYAVSWQKTMMWLFIVNDAVLFAGFLGAYAFNRLSSDRPWPDQAEVFNLNFITMMTFVLITSSATMATAVRAASTGNRALARRFVWLTVLCGVVFLGMQAAEWSHFIHAGARLTSNPWGQAGFSGFFFMITGFHGTHVLIGVIILVIVALRSTRRDDPGESVELAGLYWHFVDLVWVFVFGCFYLV